MTTRLEPGPNPIFRTCEDGSVRLETEMPDVLAISRDLLEDAGRVHQPPPGAPALLEWRGDMVDIRLANGRWAYEIVGWRDYGATAVCQIRYREERP